MVYGIKDSMLCGKNITQQIDCDLDTKVNNFTKNVTILTNKVGLIYNYIKKKMEKEHP